MANLKEITAMDTKQGKKFGGMRKRLAAETGGKEIGCSWYEIPPGRQAFPHHGHFGNEEAFFILSGNGILRLGDERYILKAGDYVSCPSGTDAHSIINSGETSLCYLGISTAHSTDIVVYPDSKKFAAVGGADMQKGLKSASFSKILKDQPNVDYLLDEE